MPALTAWFGRLLRGKLSMETAFWNWTVGGGFLLACANFFLLSSGLGQSAIAGVALGTLTAVHVVISVVSVWSSRARHWTLTWSARLIVTVALCTVLAPILARLTA
ncbi:hypothetical protein CKO28_00525 [Rhodovibrio sodomensis]|uniref:DUF3649 domain-containing protein n=1 Tax=Rhodovibrio sodomensis TaxID=1088 RepID=A0ABS1D854_9PROT|nr:hypothetical protein [Rhodovibrio sodomensis]MBK1666525.1 hypothetical protein [Rhodovibrio sodomensis]